MLAAKYVKPLLMEATPVASGTTDPYCARVLPAAHVGVAVGRATSSNCDPATSLSQRRVVGG